MELQTTFLDAIQAIPGETPGEKFQYISKLVQNSIKNGDSVEKLIKSHQLPHIFQPLYEIEAAKILKNNEKVVEALKSEDSLILNRAFSASMFFDGSDKRIVNVKYFKENILPYVSLSTRLRIIKGLAIHLGSKQSKLAEEFFTMFAEMYGIDQAMPLLTACSENFTYNTIVEKKIVLSRKLVKILYRKNPNLVIRYLKLATSKLSQDERTPHKINLANYIDFLSKLIKKNLRAFVEIFEACENDPPSIHLSNKLAAVFLKSGKQHLIEKPHLYFPLLPLNIIDPQTMKIIFPKLIPREKNHFDTNTMLEYLKYYPEKEKLRLLMETYEQCYGRSILDDTNNVTPELLLILSTEERIRQARIKLQKDDEDASRTFTFQRAWRCYLPTNEIIPVIKEEISKTAKMEDRMRLLVQMMYCCKVNQDDEALLEVLKYFQTRHKNEQGWLITSFMNNFLHEYDFQKLSEDHWHIINDIIRRSYVKGILQPGSTTTKLLIQSIQYKLTHNIPIEQSIEMFVEFKAYRYEGNMWNILIKFPEYEKKCLATYIEVLLKKYMDPPTAYPWNSPYGILHDILASITDYHNRHLKGIELSTTLNNMKYSALLERIFTTMKLPETEEEQNDYTLKELKDLLRKSDKNLYALWFKEKTESEIAKVSSGKAISLLRKNPHDIMEHWEEYLKECENSATDTNVMRFVKAIRWYKDIPIKWSIQCQKDLTEKKNRNALRILGILLDGQSFTILINPLIPKEKSIETNSEEAKENHDLIASIPRVMNIVNPPPPLEIVGEFCKGDYLSAGLVTLTNVCRRSSVAKVLPFAKTLADQRVSVRKHGMRLIYMVAHIEELCDYFLSQWKTEQHYSIRAVLVNKIYDLFTHHPTSATWNLLEHCISTFTVDDTDSLNDVIKLKAIPNEYISNYVKLLSETINNLEKLGLEHHKMAQHIRTLLHSIDPLTCNLLSEEFSMGLIEKFFFDPNPEISQSAKHFTLISFLSDESTIKSRLNLFSKFFIDVVKAQWNVPHPKKSRFYPVNYAVHDFIEDLVQSYLSGRELEMYLIDNMLKSFETVINPRMDAQSFLLLLYAKEKYQSKSPKDFGIRIGRKIQELINIYSEFFVSFMTDTLQYFLKSSLFFEFQGDDVTLGVIEGLVEVKSHCTHFMAAKLLSPVTNEDYVERYDHLIRVLVEDKQSDITSIICNMINNVSFQACISDC